MKNSVSTEAKLKRETGWTLLQYQAVKHTYKLRSTASTLTQAYNHITLVVAATDSCFVLMRTHRNGTAPGERSHLRSSIDPAGYYRGEYRLSQSPSLLISGSGSLPRREGLLSPATRQICRRDFPPVSFIQSRTVLLMRN